MIHPAFWSGDFADRAAEPFGVNTLLRDRTFPTFLFVYNADSGPLKALFDFGHKIVSPGTYPCSLCRLTYGPFGMRREW